MADPEAIKRLIEAVASGNIRVLGADAFRAINSGYGVYVDGRASTALRAYSGDLNDAKALHESWLSGWWWAKEPDGSVSIGCRNHPPSPFFGVESADPARNWLLAQLRAKSHQIAMTGGEL